jgi:hypothetical protein
LQTAGVDPGHRYFANQMPPDLALPSWAVTPPTATNNTWNEAIAYTESQASEFPPSPGVSTTHIHHLENPDSFFPKVVIIASPVCSSPKIAPKELAGAVVGGVLGLALIGLFGLFLFRPEAARAEASAATRSISETASIDSVIRQKAAQAKYVTGVEESNVE